MSLRKKVSSRLTEFLNPLLELSTGISGGPRRLIRDVVFGALTSRSLMVSEIARTLFDQKAKLFHREKRICQGLASEGWNEEFLRQELVTRNLEHVREETLIVGDFSEVVKPYGKEFEYLDRVRDASDPRKEPPAIKPGYWLWETYVEVCPGDLRPLQIEPLSLQEPGVLSLPAETQKYLKSLKKALGSRLKQTIRVLDRGFDSLEQMRWLVGEEWRFIVRQRGDRVVYGSDEQLHTLRDLGREWLEAKSFCEGSRMAMGRVRLPYEKEWLWVVAYEGEKGKREPLWLLVRDEKIHSLADGECCVHRYLRRWGGEDAVRFLKQAVGIESFRVRSWRAIRRLILLGAWAMTFLAELEDGEEEWVEEVKRQAFTFEEPVKIMVYHLSRGLARILTGQSEGCPVPSGYG